jgi:glycosyltransferase involved in cell wall biosynthesis
MKIAVAGTRGFPGIQGGVEKHCESLYTHLIEMGCDITVYVREPYIQSSVKEYKGVKLVSVGCPRNKFLEAIVHTFKCVLKARRLNPDILHVHAIGPSLFVPLARLLGLRVVATNHGPDYKREKWPYAAKLFLRFCEWAGMKYANEIISISNDIADELKKKFDRDASVIPNGIDAIQTATTEEILRKYDLQKGKYILSVGRFVPEKGFHDLIEAYVTGGFKEYKLVIVGAADHEDKYSRSLRESAGRNEHIILTGLLTGTPLEELYTHAGLFVLPSYYEGHPIVLLEAMSHGLSCIASDIPSNRNIELKENRFFEAGNVKKMRDKINEYITKEWDELSRKRQMQFIYETYNWCRIAAETLNVYRRVI